MVLEVMLGEFGAVAVSSLSQAWTARWAAGKYKMPSYPQTYAEALYCTKNSEPLFDVVENCRQDGRETQTVVSDLDGTLLRSRSSFPYFMLIALEAGSPLRALVLLLLSPLVWLVYNFVSESVGIKMLIFFSFAGLRLSAIESAARGVLPKFYLEDMHSISYRLFIACGRRYVVTANPRIMVEPFLKEYLDVEAVMGTEIQATSGGYATGFVASSSSGVLVGMNKRSAVKNFFANETPDIGLGDRESDYPFMSICKVSQSLSFFPSILSSLLPISPSCLCAQICHLENIPRSHYRHLHTDLSSRKDTQQPFASSLSPQICCLEKKPKTHLHHLSLHRFVVLRRNPKPVSIISLCTDLSS